MIKFVAPYDWIRKVDSIHIVITPKLDEFEKVDVRYEVYYKDTRIGATFTGVPATRRAINDAMTSAFGYALADTEKIVQKKESEREVRHDYMQM